MVIKDMLDNLSSVSSAVDLSKVPPIHQKRLLTFVNHFIITTVTFLNNFAQTCERELLYCNQKMQKLEAELCILEAKLNSIPGLEDIQAKNEPPIGVLETDRSDTSNPPIETNCVTASTINTTANEQTNENQCAESEIATPSAAKDPELARYFKMVQFGVPIPAVKLKMQQEGFDPSLLDR